jgi:hypothetical protein
MILHLLSSVKVILFSYEAVVIRGPLRLTQRINQVDQPPSLILVLQVHVRRFVDNDGLKIRSERDVIRRPERFFTQVGKGEPCDLVDSPRDFDLSSIHIDRRLGACTGHGTSDQRLVLDVTASEATHPVCLL